MLENMSNIKNLRSFIGPKGKAVVQKAIIPIIQRDYAQGRTDPSTSEKRHLFLSNLFDALNEQKILSLDFIYGSGEKDSFSILDGQQRLTTLFLLSWYLACVDGKQEDFVGHFYDEKTQSSRFTYSTRTSAREFLDTLAGIKDFNVSACKEHKLSEVLKNRCDFFPFWAGDPTVQSCLNMLDDIHKKFFENFGFYTKLERITFKYLLLENYGLSDDLYLKMNARGKSLTSFENFKAVFYEILDSQKDIREIKNKVDGKWMDFFWDISRENREDRNLEKVTEGTNKIYLKFFLLMGLLRLSEHQSSSKEGERPLSKYPINLDIDRFFPIKEELEKECVFDQLSIERLECFLDALSESKESFTFYSQDIFYLETIELQTKFCAAALFVQCIGTPKQYEIQWHHWQRVTNNLLQNGIIHATELPKILAGLSKLIQAVARQKEKDIYLILRDSKENIFGSFTSQWREEQEKAQLILSHPDWERVIEDAESIPYLNGQIEGILNICKKEEKKALIFEDLPTFEVCSKQIRILLSENILGGNDWLLHRALLSKGAYFIEAKNKFNFCSNLTFSRYRERNENWLAVLRDREKTFLWKKLLVSLQNEVTLQKIEEKLREIIQDYIESPSNYKGEKDAWRWYMISEVESFKRCEKSFVWWWGEEEYEAIQLLKGSDGRSFNCRLENWFLWKKMKEQKICVSLEQNENKNDQVIHFKNYKINFWEGSFWVSEENDWKNLKEEKGLEELKEIIKDFPTLL